jgi:hypothetical protein
MFGALPYIGRGIRTGGARAGGALRAPAHGCA